MGSLFYMGGDSGEGRRKERREGREEGKERGREGREEGKEGGREGREEGKGRRALCLLAGSNVAMVGAVRSDMYCHK